MQPIHEQAIDSYCLHCYAPADESARACAQCRTAFTGSGAYHRVRGPRPSPLFAELFASGSTASSDACGRRAS